MNSVITMPADSAPLSTELLAGALLHLKAVMESKSPRACAVACILFSCLARDETLGDDLCQACQAMGECLERMSDSAKAWGAL